MDNNKRDYIVNYIVNHKITYNIYIRLILENQKHDLILYKETIDYYIRKLRLGFMTLIKDSDYNNYELFARIIKNMFTPDRTGRINRELA
jgi:hypothetical protein